MSKIGYHVAGGCCVALLLMLANLAGAAQNPNTPSRELVVVPAHHHKLTGAIYPLLGGNSSSATATGFYTLANPVAEAGVGYGATTSNGSAIGEWTFGTVSGDPETQVDDNFSIIGATSAEIFDENADNEQIIGTTGLMTTAPFFNQKSQTGGWVWNTQNAESNFNVELKLSLVRDIVYYEYDITNLNPDFRQVGFDVTALLNTFSSIAGTAPTYYVPTVGSVNTVEVLTGTQVPNSWFIRDGTALIAPDNHPPLKFEQLFSGKNTRPAQLVFGNYDTATTDDVSLYNWQTILNAQNNPVFGQAPLMNNGDALALYQNATAVKCLYPIVSIGAGQTYAIIGQMQCNWASVGTLGQYPNQGVLAASVRVPEWLGAQTNSVEIDGYLCNSAQLFNSTATITIDPGSGFQLATGQSATYQNINVPEFSANATESTVKWMLVPNWSTLSPQTMLNSSGYPINITATFNPGGTISTTGYINIPTVTTAQTIPTGIQFLGWPFQFSSNLSTSVFNNLSANTLYWYNSATGEYQDGYSNGFTITPGNGYWIDSTASNNVQVSSKETLTPLTQTTSYTEQLNPGWNAISNPFEYAIVWGYCQVMYNYKVYSISDAVQLGLIRGELWSWNTYASPQQYSLPSSDFGQQLIPNVGYWLFAGDAVSLIFDPNPYIAVMSSGNNAAGAMGASATATTRTRTASQNQWQIKLVATAGTAIDRTTTFGVSPSQLNGPSGGNLMKPPISPQGVSAYFPHTNWGRMSGQYAVELQAPAATNTWSLDVACVQTKAQVTLSWPDLTGIPAKMPVILTDLATGQQISMRTSPGYTFNSVKGTVRHFSITAGGVQTALQFTQVQALINRARGGTSINFGISIGADVKVNLRTPTGRLFRTLEVSNAVGGSNTIFWDGKDAQGRVLPHGIYLCELYAEAADGQSVRSSLALSK